MVKECLENHFLGGVDDFLPPFTVQTGFPDCALFCMLFWG
jgi:hypothetical protein